MYVTRPTSARPTLLASSLLRFHRLLHTESFITGITRPRHSLGRCSKEASIRSFANMAPIERVTDKLEQPALDDRSYRVIRLPNKLETLLVHDADTDKASAAVNVNVGSFSDADDMPGMAHAVEHLLFMGTKKASNLVHVPTR